MKTHFSYEPLDPSRFLARSAFVFKGRVGVIDGDNRFTYDEFYDRCARLAGGLASLGVTLGDRVAILCPNTHALLEATFGVPMAGAVLVAMNTRLSPEELAYILDHSGSKVLLYDTNLSPEANKVAELVPGEVILVELGTAETRYERLVSGSEPAVVPVEDERGLLSINYTSGTTGKPKGVMYHRRGAYLQALAMAWQARLDPGSVFLWTLPMFHCNGWCFPWAVTLAGAVHLCLPKVDPALVWQHIHRDGVTHFNAAPTVLISLVNHPAAEPAPRKVTVCTGGAPPSPTLLAKMAELNMEVIHLYGLTETYGPITACEWRPEWDELPLEEQASLKARQGVGNIISEDMRVVDGSGRDVPADGKTMGEVALRGNNLMLGFYRDEEATSKAVPDGWFRTGDIGVMHPDGYVELRDRAKDVIISGGENIASIEVEQAVMSHPAVLEAAVIAHPDEKWGEVPVAYVALKEGASATEQEIISYVRDRLAHFKAPKNVVFADLPKTSTGKIQKFVLRERAWRGREKRIH